MSMKDLIRRIAPPGYEKKNRRKIYDTLGAVGEVAASDAVKVIRDFFPYLSSDKALKRHAESLGIPRYASDTDEAYRMRVATAAFYIFRKGTRDFFRTAMEQRFPGRQYDLVEGFLTLDVKLADMTEEDRDWIREFFWAELDPNIVLRFIYWFLWTDDLPADDDALTVDLACRPEISDVWDWGFTFDGQALFDHGKARSFDGTYSFNGDITWEYFYWSVLGTWTGHRYALWYFNGSRAFNGSLSFYAIESDMEKPTEPAFFISDDDVIELTITQDGVVSEESF